MIVQPEQASRFSGFTARENTYPWLGNAFDKVITPGQKAKIRAVLSIGGGNSGAEAVALRQWVGKRTPITVVDLQPADRIAEELHSKHRIRYIQAEWFDTITDENNTLIQDADLIVCRHPPIEGGTPVTLMDEGVPKPAIRVLVQDEDFFYRLTGLAQAIAMTRSAIAQHLVITTWNSMPDTLLRAKFSQHEIPYRRVVFNGGRTYRMDIADIPSEIQEDHYLLHVQSR